MKEKEVTLDKLSKNEIYKLAGINIPKVQKKKKVKVIDPQIEALLKNRAITQLIKDLYNSGKSHQSIATTLNKIAIKKFTPNKKTVKNRETKKDEIIEVIPKFNKEIVFSFCIKKKIGTNELRIKNLTGKELIMLDDNNRIEMIKQKAVKFDKLNSDVKKRLEEFNAKDTRDWTVKTFFVNILITKQTAEKYSKTMGIPLDLINDTRSAANIDETFYTED